MPTPNGPVALATALAAALALSGCATPDPEVRFPGVFTHSEVRDDIRCGALLLGAGCPIVRIPAVDSGCVPEVPGYILCNATVAWSVEAGAVVPQSRLVVEVNGTPAGSCTANPGAVCSLEGVAGFEHRFGGPGERHHWNVTIAARLEAPGEAEGATGEFTLTVAMVVRAQDAGAADVDV